MTGRGDREKGAVIRQKGVCTVLTVKIQVCGQKSQPEQRQFLMDPVCSGKDTEQLLKKDICVQITISSLSEHS